MDYTDLLKNPGDVIKSEDWNKIAILHPVYINPYGNTTWYSDFKIVNTRNTHPTLVKEILLHKVPSSKLKISFSLYKVFYDDDDSFLHGEVYGQIYRNYSPVGTKHIIGKQDYFPMRTFIEMIDGWKDGDRLQLYIWTTGYPVCTFDLSILGNVIYRCCQSTR